jgi:hypothetical protein
LQRIVAEPGDDAKRICYDALTLRLSQELYAVRDGVPDFGGGGGIGFPSAIIH